ncbi:Flp family type IVb pilin [Marinomonas ostreistagni]|uniref:Flp family type IVb pilin n=1 Tax=Marinomonas ostreistagni TaxID=359209 RepID=A0ABS0ZCS6_9GAMM|nr:Flp family type IVb pilin [Marinomonas ostreistagni]MBJ7551475.1 Flp family type IVb pilin [Marinomonas ostreistagni]
MLTKLFAKAQAFMGSREGVTAIEYAVVAVAIAGIAAAVFGSDGGLQTALTTAMTTLSGFVTGTTGS